jgi:hypothetical protein
MKSLACQFLNLILLSNFKFCWFGVAMSEKPVLISNHSAKIFKLPFVLANEKL